MRILLGKFISLQINVLFRGKEILQQFSRARFLQDFRIPVLIKTLDFGYFVPKQEKDFLTVFLYEYFLDIWATTDRVNNMNPKYYITVKCLDI